MRWYCRLVLSVWHNVAQFRTKGKGEVAEGAGGHTRWLLPESGGGEVAYYHESVILRFSLLVRSDRPHLRTRSRANVLFNSTFNFHSSGGSRRRDLFPYWNTLKRGYK